MNKPLVITTQEKELELSYDYKAKEFTLTSRTCYFPLYINKTSVVELTLMEAQQIASHIQNCILEL